LISKKSIEELKNRIDIVEIISHYLSVKKFGSNYKCVCPFHDDHNPSMSINSRDNYFHCFTCKAGGDAIKFVMDYEKINYPEAIEKIAGMLNFALEYTNEKSEFKVDKKILETVNAHYQSELFRHQEAVDYLYERGFDNNLIYHFGLGWAGSSAELLRLLENEQISKEDALKVGILKANSDGIFASFINRITFPINNHAGKLVGFGGRTISNHPAKYVNSPQSVVFDKSRTLYAYDLAKKPAMQKREVIVTEGYMDTIMLHKAGLNNAIAVLGTALTSEHVPLLRRLESRVILSFDGDGAGINAAFKSAKLLTANEIDCNVVIIPEGADPADMVCAGKFDELKKLYENGVEGGSWVIAQIASQFDLSRPINRQKALEAIAEFTKTLPPVAAQGYVNEIENLLKSKFNPNLLLKTGNARANFAPNSQPNFSNPSNKKNDYLELQIIKSALRNAEFLYLIKDIVSEQSFFCHRELFKSLDLANKNLDESAELRELMLNDSVPFYESESDLRRGLIALQERFLKHQKEWVRTSDRADKFELLRKIENDLRRLKGLLK